MSDINIKVNGDSSSAQNALKETGRAVGSSVAAWTEMAGAVKKAGAMVVQFATDSVKAYAESERIQKQLVRVAGEYADALDAQAQALSRLNAVDDDTIKQSQMLLTQWGGVGAATSKVTQAVLDYAAATGTDATAATQELIRNVESGGVGMAKLGVHFKSTGDKSKDLGALVEALGKKFGGAGAADASSLSGQLKLAELAFEDVQKAFGGLIGSIESKTGIIDKVAGALRGIAQAIGKVDSFESAAALFSQQGIFAAAVGGMYTPAAAPSDAGLPGIGSVKGRTNAAMRAAASAGGKTQSELDDESLERAKKFQRELDSIDEHAQKQEEEAYVAELEASAKRVETAQKEAEERLKVRRDLYLQLEKDQAEHAEKMAKAEAEAEKKAAKEAAERAKEQARQWKATGDQIGSAFVNALTDQLQKLAEGGEFDAASFIGDVLASVFAVAASAIGTAYGMPALGAALGNLGAVGIRAGFGAASAGAKKARTTPQYHSGGWVGAPRYHSGSWIGSDEERAILQHGERVLSRQEVSAMGGSGAVDRAARGGGAGLNVTINAIDSRSAAEAFERDLGRSMRRAVASGRGDLAQLMGVNPR